MSYILEALKKSQRDRELGQVPDLSAEPYTDSSAAETGNSAWIISSASLALVALLVALYGIFGHQLFEQQAPGLGLQTQPPVVEVLQSIETVADKEPSPASAGMPEPNSATNVTVEPKPADAPESITAFTPTQEKPASQAPGERTPAVSATSKPQSRQAEVEKIRQEYVQMLSEAKQLKKNRRQQQKSATPTVAEPAMPIKTPAVKAYPAVHELPAEVQSRLPPRNIMLQSYSEEPARRFVILNSVKLYQGEGTADGLQVLEIGLDGLLLGFEGYEFFQTR